MTLDHLAITGGYAGIEANDTGSQRLTISNSEVYGNADYGIQLNGYTIDRRSTSSTIASTTHGFIAGISVGSGNQV